MENIKINFLDLLEREKSFIRPSSSRGRHVSVFVIALLVTALVTTAASAALTLGGTSIVSDGALTLTGAAASTWDIGANNTLSLQTTNNGAITTGAGTLTVAGAFVGNGNLTLGDTSADTVTVTGVLQGASPLVFEGATADDIETTFAITDPTASDKTITFPNVSGTVLLTGADIQFDAGAPRNITIAQSSAGSGGAAFTITGAQGGNAVSGGNGQAGGSVNITGGAGTVLNAGADGDGGDVVLLGGTRGGSSAQQGIVRVGSPSIGSTRATNLLAVGGGLEVDGATRFDGAVTLAGGNLTVNAGRKIAHASVTSGAHGVNFSMIGTLNYNTANISSGATIGVIPANADITGVRVLVPTAFTTDGGDGTNYIDCGPSGNLTAYVTLVGVASNNVLTNRLFYITASGPAANYTDVGASDVTVQCRHEGARLSEVLSAGQVKLIIDYVVD